MLPFTPQYFYVLLGVIITNLAIHYWNKHNLYEYLGSIPQLLKLNGVAKEFLKYNLHTKINSELPDSIRMIDMVKKRMAFFKLEAKLESDAEIVFWGMLELIKARFLLEPLLLFGVLKQLDSKRKEIEKVFSFVGYVDSLISIASLRQGLKMFCLPELNDNFVSLGN
jgi:DNA mismatch repair ATPase MutS